MNLLDLWFVFQGSLSWQNGGPVSYQLQEDQAKQAGVVSYFLSFPATFFRRKIKCENRSNKLTDLFLPQNKNLRNLTSLLQQATAEGEGEQACIVMLLTNFAQPQWIPIRCNADLANIVR